MKNKEDSSILMYCLSLFLVSLLYGYLSSVHGPQGHHNSNAFFSSKVIRSISVLLVTALEVGI